MRPSVLKNLALGVSLIALVGCGDGKPKEEAVKSYESVDACKADISQDATEEERQKVSTDCATGFEQSKVEQERTAPHYNTLGECVDMYGPDRCGISHTGSGYVPFMTGFMLGYVAGAPIYHPYYYDRYHVVYSGGTNLGYYRNGYVVAPAGSTWTRSYSAVTINKGTLPPATSVRTGGFGGSAARSAGRSVVSNPVSPSGRSVVSNPVSPSGRASSGVSPGAARGGGFGGSAASAASSSSG